MTMVDPVTQEAQGLRPKVCRTCSYWDPYINDQGYGDCRRIGPHLETAPLAAIVSLTPGTLTTKGDFGCVLHEGRW